MDQNLGIGIIFALTFMFLAFYFWGRSKNYKIQKNTWTRLRSHVKPYGKKVGFKSLGSSAFQISVPGRKRDSFERTELTAALLPRDILIQYLISKIQGKKDEIIVKVQFKNKPKFRLEMLSKNLKVSNKGEIELKEIEITAAPTHIKAFTSDKNSATFVIRDSSVKKELKKLWRNLNFLSLSKNEPNLIFACSISPEVFAHIFPLVESIGAKIFDMSMTRKR